MGKTISVLITILTAIIGLAIIAVVFSKQSATTEVIKSATGGFSNILNKALSPIR